jgi:hypothetical protein
LGNVVRTKQAARSHQREAPVALDWYEDEAEEVPNPSLPDGRRLARRQVWTRRYVKWSVIACPVLLLAALAAITKASHTPTLTAPGSPGQVAATVELDQWLAEQPSPLPGASILSYDGATPLAPPKGYKGPALTWKGAIEEFTLVTHPTSNDPSIWHVGVEVAINRHGGAIAISGPSFLRSISAQPGSWSQGGPWPGLDATSSVSGAVQTVIDNWLAAYTSGNDAELHLAVGDPNPAHTYIALSNVRSASDTVLAAAPVGKPADGYLAVEISLSLVWDHEHVASPNLSDSGLAGTSGTTASPAPQTTMDLLVAHASSAAPVVVAWGPPGSGPSLRPYENAIGG